MKRAIVSVAIVGLSLAANNDELFSLGGIEHAAKNVGGNVVNGAKNVGHFVVNHQQQIEGAITTGITVAKFVGEIAADSEDNELFHLGHELKKAEHFVERHPETVATGIKIATAIAADSEDNELFNLKHELKNAGHFVEKHPELVVTAIAADSEDNELFNLKHELKNAGHFVEKHPELVVTAIAADSEDNELFHLGRTLKKLGDFVSKHHKAIEDGIKTIKDIKDHDKFNDILDDGVQVYNDATNNQLFGLKNIEEAGKKAGHFVVQHHKGIEQAIGAGIQIARVIAADAEDDELFSLKKEINKANKFVNENHNLIQDGIKTVNDVYNGNVADVLNDGVKIIGDASNNQLNVEKNFLGF